MSHFSSLGYDRMETRNHAGQCRHPDCDKSVPENEILCEEHKQASKDAGTELLAAERFFYGESWPPTQFDEPDA